MEIIGTEILTQLELFTNGNFPESERSVSDRYIKKLNLLLSERIKVMGYDLIFFGDFLLTTFLDVNMPFVFLSDITCDQMRPHYRKFDEKQDGYCMNLEKRSLEKSDRIIYSSEWIKQKAVEFYNVDSNKIDIVEFGANIPTPPYYSNEINMDLCRLVFIGKDWERKGGDRLLQIYEILKNDGFLCTLTIIGSEPSGMDEINDITVYPVLNKSKPADLKILGKILSESHFLVLPTIFEAFGIVFCEASAYALPSITANVGGVGQAVIDGKNGFLLPADATPGDYAEKIKTVFNDMENYLKLRKSSRKEFETRLNWDVWGEKVNKILEDVVNKWKSHA